MAGTYHSDSEPLRKLAAQHPDRVLAVPYSLGDDDSARAAVDAVSNEWGRLDALVLNAGRWIGGKLENVGDADWCELVQANVGGAAQLVRAALPELRRGTNPSVLLVSSVVGLIGHPGDTAYGSAKAALVGFALSLAKEVAKDGVRVNVVAPGFVETDMTAQVSDRARDRLAGEMLLGRFGTPEEIADAAVFLSEDATYCTGTVLTVDGGWSL
ncbi:dehydrogenase of unknown specificity, short-chain alcohol dehydrogenase like [Prauserella sp. Am3]|nr:dehydrogenase of unknown specificity, short-chain alcohol dehydrogenase like [Prauserella sp. Am3]